MLTQMHNSVCKRYENKLGSLTHCLCLIMLQHNINKIPLTYVLMDQNTAFIELLKCLSIVSPKPLGRHIG